jgi:N-acetyl-1-D-myo-inositol-2-amino-2-deoxy-alpha-D-glucopyranoside deacetylase
LHQADLLEVAAQVTTIVREQEPQVMIPFDAWGGYGHPVHIQMHKAALLAFFVAGDARAFPEQLQNGLETWTPQKLYFNVWPRSRFNTFIEHLRAEGKEIPDWLTSFGPRGMPEELITSRIDVSEFARLKLESLQCHASQLGPNTIFRQIPQDLWLEMVKHETFMLAESRTGRASGETDLFEGISFP